MAERDYSNLTNDIPIINGISQVARQKDLEEEYLRLTTFGTLNQKYKELGSEFEGYLYKVNQENIDFIFWTTNGVNFITIGFYLIFIGFIIYEVYWMRGFYRKLFQIEVNQMTKL